MLLKSNFSAILFYYYTYVTDFLNIDITPKIYHLYARNFYYAEM